MTAFIGGGNMAEALIKGMTAHGMKDIVVSEPREERRTHLEKSYGIKTSPNNLDAVKAANIIILAVKPQQMSGLLDEIGNAVTEDKAVVSIAAGITLSYLQGKLKSAKLIRAMPNAGAFAGEGMTALALCECFAGKEINAVKEIFMSIGRVMMMPERHMDAVTALSGSGPAFIALIAEAMVEAGVKMGLSAEDAFGLCVQTLTGTAKLLDGGLSPEKLIAMVKSPGGTTEAGLRVLDKREVRAAVVEAVIEAKRRAEELGSSGPARRKD